MLQARLFTYILKLLLSVFIPICFIFACTPNKALAQCLPPEATVLEGNGDFAFTAIVEISDPNDPVNGVLNLTFTTTRGDGGSEGIPVTGIPSSIVGRAILTIGVGNMDGNFGTVRITITNSCCETKRLTLTNFSRPNKTSTISKSNIRSTIQYIGNTCQAPTIESVLFEKLDGTALEPNPSLGNEITVNNKKYGGGLRFFPDATTPLGQVKKVKVKAKITPIQANIPIYFRSFDVDDSSGLFNNTANNGQDNQGPTVRNDGIPKEGKFDGFASGATVSAMTDSNGVASLDFIVTMQPGDNFKIVASTDQALITNMSSLNISGQDILDSRNNNIPLPKQPDTNEPPIMPAKAITSQLLTVWRFLHVEVDAMLAPLPPKVITNNPSEINYIKGNIEEIGILRGQNSLFFQGFITDQVLRDASFDFQTNFMGDGRFQRGSLIIGQNPPTLVAGNGEKVILVGPFTQQNVPQIPCEITDRRGSNKINTTIIQMRKGSAQNATPDVFQLISSPNSPGQYTGGRITIAGITFIIDKINVNLVELNPTVQQPPFTLPFVLFDDDQTTAPTLTYPQDFQLMQTSDLPKENLFASTYIKPIFDLTSFTTPNFRKNIDTIFLKQELVDQIAEGKDFFATNNFWTVYIQGAWQEAGSLDGDPDLEFNNLPAIGLTPGQNVVLGSVILVEMIRDLATLAPSIGMPHITQNLLSNITTVHECGHQFNLPDRLNGSNGGIMEEIPFTDPRFQNINSFAFFNSEDQKRIRTKIRPVR